MKKIHLFILAIITATIYIGCKKEENSQPVADTKVVSPVEVPVKQASSAAVSLATSLPTSATNGSTTIIKNGTTTTKTVEQNVGDGTTQKFVSKIDPLGNVKSEVTIDNETFTATGAVKESGAIQIVRAPDPTKNIESQTIVINTDNSNVSLVEKNDGSTVQTNVEPDGQSVKLVKTKDNEIASVTLTKPDGTVLKDTEVDPVIVKEVIASTPSNTPPVIVVVPPVTPIKQASDSAIAIAISKPVKPGNSTTTIVKNEVTATTTKTVEQPLGDGGTQKFVSEIDTLGNVKTEITTPTETFNAIGTVKEDGSIQVVRDTDPTGVIETQTVVIKPDNSNVSLVEKTDGSTVLTNVETDGETVEILKTKENVIASVTQTKPDGTVLKDSAVNPVAVQAAIANTPVVVNPITPTPTPSPTPVDTTVTPTPTPTPVETGGTTPVTPTPVPFTTNNPCGEVASTSNTYVPLSAGSTWQYNSYNTSLTTETIVFEGNTYHKYNSEKDPTVQYLGNVLGDIVNYVPVHDNLKIILVKKSMKKGDSWDNIGVAYGTDVNYKMTVDEINMNLSVNGIVYENVVKIKNNQIFSSKGVKLSEIVVYYYYAMNIGLIDLRNSKNQVVSTEGIKCFNVK